MLLLFISILAPNHVQAAVKLNKSKATLYIGESIKLSLSGTNSKIIWKTSNKSVAKVSKSGKVTAEKAGTSTISAVTTNNKKKYSCKVTVKKRLSSNKYTVNCAMDDEFQKIIISYKKLKDSEGLLFEIEDEKIASVDYEQLDNNKMAVYIIPNASGSTNLKIYTTQLDSSNYSYTNRSEYINIKINIGISDTDEWISEENLDKIYDIRVNVGDTNITLYKYNPKSITGLSEFLYEIPLEADYKVNVVYGTDLRYKLTEYELFFNIKDLKKLNIIG